MEKQYGCQRCHSRHCCFAVGIVARVRGAVYQNIGDAGAAYPAPGNWAFKLV